MRATIINIKRAALLAGAAMFIPAAGWCGSCCGGGGGATLSVPKYARAVADVSFDAELYNGYWNGRGTYRPDPPGSDLRQYRLNVGAGYRLAENLQFAVAVPYVWNDNTYSGEASRSAGVGDTTLSLTYELLDDISTWKIRDARDLVPGVSLTASLLLPTGVSPYDSRQSSFDITGRGFYRLDGTLLVEKTIRPWNASLSLGYGTYFERPVNREYGRYVEPYRKNLGDRITASLAAGYTQVLGTGGDALATTVSWSYVNEGDASFDGERDPGSGFSKQTFGLTLTYSNSDSNWTGRIGWNHALRRDGWGENFPVTDTVTLGVRYVFL